MTEGETRGDDDGRRRHDKGPPQRPLPTRPQQTGSSQRRKPATPPDREAARLKTLLLRFLKSLPPAGAQICASGQPAAVASTIRWNSPRPPPASRRDPHSRSSLPGRPDCPGGRRIRPLPEAHYLARHETPEPDFARPHRHIEEATASVDGETARAHPQPFRVAALVLERLKGRQARPISPAKRWLPASACMPISPPGQLQPQVTMRFEPRLGTSVKGARGGVADLSDSAARPPPRQPRADGARPRTLSGVALDICCFMKGLETVERERQWPPRSAKLMLKTALLALHRHYTRAARRQCGNGARRGFGRSCDGGL